MSILSNPVISGIARPISKLCYALTGWSVAGEVPRGIPFVAIVAPHTSNWDFPVALAAAFQFRVDVRWLGKHTLFKPPFGGFMTWLGGYPVNRTAPQGLTAQAVEMFEGEPNLILAITPEGTRSRVKEWKTGFYRIAVAANVPILMAYFDYPNKVVGLGPLFYPTGDMEKDMKEIQAFYQNFKGKYADQQWSE